MATEGLKNSINRDPLLRIFNRGRYRDSADLLY